MKVYATVLIAICTISLVAAGQHHQNRPGHDSYNDYDSNENQQQADNSYRWSNQPLASSSWAPEPEFAPFYNKISERIQGSEQLANEPEIKKKIQKLVETKMDVCKTSGTGKNKIDKHCAGRLTGQIMQLIASFENGNRNFPGWFN